ncbi:alanine racemase [Corynebacterium sp. TAE3-ERU12]|uniref:alanine racemase n=1 Tax=Corynebacterium sp. TAE3-ERU12 TaxID=2849491 RepID=UPI001C4953EB|nr:alanine racemase [Corynebacterium sp. TAE3-ERU12]MBV7294717.1 alanine racemase [Corynebacterium sp. TAE3-ERU12]
MPSIEPTAHPVTATIDLSAIAANVRRVREISGAPRIMAVVKADGYGHGIAQAARAVLAGGADQLGVATLDEARALREAGITAPVLCWLWLPDQDIAGAVGNDVDLGVASLAHLDAVIKAGQHVGKRPRVTITVDTGMNRNGFSAINGDLSAAAPRIAQAHGEGLIDVTGAATHFSNADDPDDPSIDMQADRFRAAIAELRAEGLTLPVNHAANSAASLSRPDLVFDMIRPGLVNYGLEPIAGRSHGLVPAMTLSARIGLVKDVPAGEAVSYGRTWNTDHDTRVAVVPFGYADGMPRSLSDRCSVWCHGTRFHQIGRVCMDQFVIEVDDSVHTGDEVVIFGPGAAGNQPGAPTADELAETLGTINYEIVTMPRGRTVRRYIES